MNPYALFRPFLFSLDAERAHHLAFSAWDRVAATPLAALAVQPPVADPVEVLGLTFPNRVGLAAGLDKDATHIAGLVRMGFGFVELGTVTPKPQPGNPAPRMFRLPEARAVINRMGFNNGGLEAFVANVRAARAAGVTEAPHGRVLLGLNLGKNAVTPIERAADDYVAGLEATHALADYLTINVSSPNTKNLRALQGGDEMNALLAALAQARARLADRDGKRVPMLVKIAPDLDEDGVDAIADALVAHGVDGVIATNTTISRDAVKGLPHADEAGGLSGAPVFEASNRVIRRLRARLPASMPIVGVGGVLDGDQAAAKLEAGATLVQLYTGLIYRGPALVAESARACADWARRREAAAAR